MLFLNYLTVPIIIILNIIKTHEARVSLNKLNIFCLQGRTLYSIFTRGTRRLDERVLRCFMWRTDQSCFQQITIIRATYIRAARSSNCPSACNFR